MGCSWRTARGRTTPDVFARAGTASAPVDVGGQRLRGGGQGEAGGVSDRETGTRSALEALSAGSALVSIARCAGGVHDDVRDTERRRLRAAGSR